MFISQAAGANKTSDSAKAETDPKKNNRTLEWATRKKRTMIALLDTIPADEVSTGQKSKDYLTDEAVTLALHNPRKVVPLAQGKLVDKAYLGALRLQAMTIDPRLEIGFQLVEKGSDKTKSGKTSYYYKGRVFLTFAQKEKKEKKAKKTQVLAVSAEA